MPEVSEPYQPGTPCWIDVVAPDQAAALGFYAGVLGWEGSPGPPETGGYALCTLKGRPVAGIMSAESMGDQPAPPPAWTTYFASADADATLQAITRNGGTVFTPAVEVMNLGRMVVAADPTGAVFGVWEPREFPGAGIVNEPGALIWNELNTTDHEAAAAFYGAALGIRSAPMEGAEGYFALSVDGRPVGGMQQLSEDAAAEVGSRWLVYFAVADTDGAVARVLSAGGTVGREPFEMVAGRMAVVRDSQGAAFALIAPKPMST
ncbi:VOC family protein [Streptomyces lonegramiae]|uniref:VOC family protein n=1 Tax=Streptomyces lonegramiae TaxID=3075524 RepID=A0ABU2XS77_9ACTN|nr:VOC family protein [Streptomyces sp. DSM 41529]MDT0548780.1 VOC family protein [Streptomyces sp. DSM 41529]